MKVSNFNGSFLPNKQNKEQKSNLQNKALNQNPVNFKGSAANDSLAAMGQAQVNINKSNNLSFKGKDPSCILANVREGKRPEQLRYYQEIFKGKVSHHWPSEEHFDKEVTDFMLDGDKRLNMDRFGKIVELTYNNSSMGHEKFCDHVLPKNDDILTYAQTHPIHRQKWNSLRNESDKGNITSTAATVAGIGAIALATGGVGLILGLAGGLAGTGGGIVHRRDMAQKKDAFLEHTVTPDLTAKCFDYKLKEMINRGKVEVGEAVEVVRHYR
jgi:hypothetical protein